MFLEVLAKATQNNCSYRLKQKNKKTKKIICLIGILNLVIRIRVNITINMTLMGVLTNFESRVDAVTGGVSKKNALNPVPLSL